MVLYEITEKGLENIIKDQDNWKWFTLEECKKLEHVILDEDEYLVKYLYSSDKGIFPNNLDIIEKVFRLYTEHVNENETPHVIN
jgi:hypothetical protein